MRRPASLPGRLVAAALGAGALTSAAAHHGVARYRMDVVLDASGVVGEWRWQSPHTHLSLRVAAGDTAETWDIEGAPPRWMAGQGFTPDSLAPGEAVTIVYHPFRSGADGGILMEVTRADGETLKVNRPARLGGP